MKILGTKKIFLEVDDSNIEMDLVPVRLCIMGNFIGTLESGTYMPSFIGALKDILENDHYYNRSINDSNFKSFFYEDKVICDSFRVTLEETFDDFSKRVVRNDNDIYFTWFLYADHFFNYPENKVEEIIFSKCGCDDLQELINDLSKWWLLEK